MVFIIIYHMNDIQANTALFEKELRSSGRAGIEDMIKAVRKSGFYNVGGSGGHDLEKGGTLNHSLWVLFVARGELKKHPEKYSGVTDDSLILVCLLHDLGNTSPSVAYHRYYGHGKRSALIVDRVKRHHGLVISDVELSAIRFHRGHHIKDDFDKRLDAFSTSSLIKLLKYADWTAAGVFNGVPFGSSEINYLLNSHEKYDFEVTYLPSVKYWYCDTRTMSDGLYPTPKGIVDPSTLSRKKVVEDFYAIQVYGSMSSYDLRFMKDETGGIGVFTTVDFRDDFGSLYRSDGTGFGYKKAVLYFNKYGRIFAPAYYLAVENMRGQWSMIKITLKGVYDFQQTYKEFEERHLIAGNCQSEADAVRAVRNMKHRAVDLKNGYFFRIPIQ